MHLFNTLGAALLMLAVAPAPAQAQQDAAAPGTVLYEVTWRSGSPGSHSGTAARRVDDGHLVGAGVDLVTASPYLPETANYAVEAEIQRVESAVEGGFGIVLWELFRDRFVVEMSNGEAALVHYRGGLAGGLVPRIDLGRVAFDPGQELHLYRAEKDGAELRLFVDGRLLLEAATGFREAPTVASPRLSTANTIVRVRSFRIVAL